MTLAPIYKSAEYVGAAYAPSLNAALREIESKAGVTAVVLAPLGGARTKAQCDALGTSWTISDHWEGRGRAVDINNRGDVTTGIARKQGVTFTRAVQLYYAIFAKYGWRNITVDGLAFPSEPWHLANHSTTPAGTGGVPLPDSPETIRKKGSKDMSILLYGPDTGTATAPGPKVFVVASPGVWDRYSASFAVPLGSQYGSAVELSLASMLAKQEQYLNPIGYGGGTAPGVATAAEIAAETKTLLASDFAAIPAAVIDEQKKPGN